MQREIKMIVSCILIISIGFLNSGCSLFASKTQTLTVTATEDDAEIYINGNLEGRGIAQVRIVRNQDVGIMVKKEGYHTAVRTIGTSFSTVGILDLIGGCIWLVPFFGILASGSQELYQNNITVSMSKIDE